MKPTTETNNVLDSDLSYETSKLMFADPLLSMEDARRMAEESLMGKASAAYDADPDQPPPSPTSAPSEPRPTPAVAAPKPDFREQTTQEKLRLGFLPDAVGLGKTMVRSVGDTADRLVGTIKAVGGALGGALRDILDMPDDTPEQLEARKLMYPDINKELPKFKDAIFEAVPKEDRGFIIGMMEDSGAEFIATAAFWKLMAGYKVAGLGAGKFAELVGLSTRLGVSSAMSQTLVGDEKSVGLRFVGEAADYVESKVIGRPLTAEESKGLAVLDYYEKLGPNGKIAFRAFDSLVLSGIVGAAFEVPGAIKRAGDAFVRLSADQVSKLAAGADVLRDINKVAAAAQKNPQASEKILSAMVKQEAKSLADIQAAVPKGMKTVVSTNKLGLIDANITVGNNSVRLRNITPETLQEEITRYSKLVPEAPAMVPAAAVPEALPEFAERLRLGLPEGSLVSRAKDGTIKVSFKGNNGVRVTAEATEETVDDFLRMGKREATEEAVEETSARSFQWVDDVIEPVAGEGVVVSIPKDMDKATVTYTSTDGTRRIFTFDNTEEGKRLAGEFFDEHPKQPPKPKGSAQVVVNQQPTQVAAAPVAEPVVAEATAPRALKSLEEYRQEFPGIKLAAEVRASGRKQAGLKYPLPGTKAAVESADEASDLAMSMTHQLAHQRNALGGAKLDEFPGLRQALLDESLEGMGFAPGQASLAMAQAKDYVRTWVTEGKLKDGAPKFVLNGLKPRSGSTVLGAVAFEALRFATDNPTAATMILGMADAAQAKVRGRENLSLPPWMYGTMFAGLAGAKAARSIITIGYNSLPQSAIADLVSISINDMSALVEISADPRVAGAIRQVVSGDHGNMVRDVMVENLTKHAQRLSGSWSTATEAISSYVPRNLDGVVNGNLKLPDIGVGLEEIFSTPEGFHRGLSDLAGAVRAGIGDVRAGIDAATELTNRVNTMFRKQPAGTFNEMQMQIFGEVSLENGIALVSTLESIQDTAIKSVLRAVESDNLDALIRGVANANAFSEILATRTLSKGGQELLDFGMVGTALPGVLKAASDVTSKTGVLRANAERLMRYGKAYLRTPDGDVAFMDMVKNFTSFNEAGVMMSRGVFNSLLSGITTITESAVSNAFAQVVNLSSQAIKAGLEFKAGDQVAAYESAVAIFKYFGALPQAIREGYDVLKTGIHSVDPDAVRAPVYHAGARAMSHGFGLGSDGYKTIMHLMDFLNLDAPSRLMMAADVVPSYCAKAMAAHDKTSELIRTYMREGNKSLEEAMAFVAAPAQKNIIYTHADRYSRAAVGQATTAIGREDTVDLVGRGIGYVDKMIGNNPVFGAIVPFFKTGANLLHWGLTRSPLRRPLEWSMGKNSKMFYGNTSEKAAAMAEMLAGSVIFGGIYSALRASGAQYVPHTDMKAGENLRRQGLFGGSWRLPDGTIVNPPQADAAIATFEVFNLVGNLFLGYQNPSASAADDPEFSMALAVAGDMLLFLTKGTGSNDRLLRLLGERDPKRILDEMTGILGSAAVPGFVRNLNEFFDGYGLKPTKVNKLGGERVTKLGVLGLTTRKTVDTTGEIGMLYADNGVNLKNLPKELVEFGGAPLPPKLTSMLAKSVNKRLSVQLENLKSSVERIRKTGGNPKAFLDKAYKGAVKETLGDHTEHIMRFHDAYWGKKGGKPDNAY